MERGALKQYQEYKEEVYDFCRRHDISPNYITFREFRERIKDHKTMTGIIMDTINSIVERNTAEQLIEEYYS
jgi:hypothetical protein